MFNIYCDACLDFISPLHAMFRIVFQPSNMAPEHIVSLDTTCGEGGGLGSPAAPVDDDDENTTGGPEASTTMRPRTCESREVCKKKKGKNCSMKRYHGEGAPVRTDPA
jgi:hypothetical protein